MNKIELNENGFAPEDGYITIQHYHPETGEKLHTEDYFCMVGTGIPAASTTDIAPNARDGHTVCRNEEKQCWENVRDHRGKTVFHKKQRFAVQVETLGELHEDFTELPPDHEFSIWSEEKQAWVYSKVVEENTLIANIQRKHSGLLISTKAEIEILQWAVDGKFIDAKGRARLLVLQKYVYDLIQMDLTDPYNIVWPEEGQPMKLVDEPLAPVSSEPEYVQPTDEEIEEERKKAQALIDAETAAQNQRLEEEAHVHARRVGAEHALKHNPKYKRREHQEEAKRIAAEHGIEYSEPDEFDESEEDA